MRKKRKVLSVDEPPSFDHQVEAWVRASYFANRGAIHLLHALIGQQTPAWSKQRKRIRRALAAFKNAARWTRISLNLPVNPKAQRRA
jgi:hypothetical protein